MIDIAYLGVILFAFVGFASVLAYYNQTCAAPRRERAERESDSPRLATAH